MSRGEEGLNQRREGEGKKQERIGANSENVQKCPEKALG